MLFTFPWRMVAYRSQNGQLPVPLPQSSFSFENRGTTVVNRNSLKQFHRASWIKEHTRTHPHTRFHVPRVPAYSTDTVISLSPLLLSNDLVIVSLSWHANHPQSLIRRVAERPTQIPNFVSGLALAESVRQTRRLFLVWRSIQVARDQRKHANGLLSRRTGSSFQRRTGTKSQVSGR